MVSRRANVARAAQMYTETDMTTDEIATELGVSRSTVYDYLSQAGVTGSRKTVTTARLVEVDERWERMFSILEQMSREMAATREELFARHEATADRLLGIIETLTTLQNPTPGQRPDNPPEVVE
jgi:predicted transcriptional regulator